MERRRLQPGATVYVEGHLARHGERQRVSVVAHRAWSIAPAPPAPEEDRPSGTHAPHHTEEARTPRRPLFTPHPTTPLQGCYPWQPTKDDKGSRATAPLADRYLLVRLWCEYPGWLVLCTRTRQGRRVRGDPRRIRGSPSLSHGHGLRADGKESARRPRCLEAGRTQSCLGTRTYVPHTFPRQSQSRG